MFHAVSEARCRRADRATPASGSRHAGDSLVRARAVSILRHGPRWRSALLRMSGGLPPETETETEAEVEVETETEAEAEAEAEAETETEAEAEAETDTETFRSS